MDEEELKTYPPDSDQQSIAVSAITATDGFNWGYDPLENFRFAPERASTAHVPGEGHAHLFIDGKMSTRLYGEWYHIPTLTPGTHKIGDPERKFTRGSHDQR